MQAHELKPNHKNKSRMRVGRGGKKGAYSGRGMKGQRSRAGRKMQPSIRELIKKFPKLRGYRSERYVEDTAIIDVEILEKKFQEMEVINPKTLLEKRIIRRIKGRNPIVKILGELKTNKKLTIEGCQISVKAKSIIEKAGGSVK